MNNYYKIRKQYRKICNNASRGSGAQKRGYTYYLGRARKREREKGKLEANKKFMKTVRNNVLII